MPEKNICGINIIGKKLMAILTFFENPLMQRPNMDPLAHAAHNSETLANEKAKLVEKNQCKQSVNKIACTMLNVQKTRNFEMRYADAERPIRNSLSISAHSLLISRTEFMPPIQMTEIEMQKKNVRGRKDDVGSKTNAKSNAMRGACKSIKHKVRTSRTLTFTYLFDKSNNCLKNEIVFGLYNLTWAANECFSFAAFALGPFTGDNPCFRELSKGIERAFS